MMIKQAAVNDLKKIFLSSGPSRPTPLQTSSSQAMLDDIRCGLFPRTLLNSTSRGHVTYKYPMIALQQHVWSCSVISVFVVKRWNPDVVTNRMYHTHL